MGNIFLFIERSVERKCQKLFAEDIQYGLENLKIIWKVIVIFISFYGVSCCIYKKNLQWCVSHVPCILALLLSSIKWSLKLKRDKKQNIRDLKGSDQWEGRGCRRSRNQYMLVGEVVLDVFLAF